MYYREYYLKNRTKILERNKNMDIVKRRKRQIAVIKCRAREKGLEFNLTHESLTWPDYCPLLGIKLNYHSNINGDDSPSVDRIDSTKGYTEDNCWVISRKANSMKSNATLEELETLVTNLRNLSGLHL